jgi:hypothetical protein
MVTTTLKKTTIFEKANIKALFTLLNGQFNSLKVKESMSKQGAIKVASSSIKPQIALATSPTSKTTTSPK